jgi:hypothetical protein
LSWESESLSRAASAYRRICTGQKVQTDGWKLEKVLLQYNLFRIHKITKMSKTFPESLLWQSLRIDWHVQDYLDLETKKIFCFENILQLRKE